MVQRERAREWEREGEKKNKKNKKKMCFVFVCSGSNYVLWRRREKEREEKSFPSLLVVPPARERERETEKGGVRASAKEWRISHRDTRSREKNQLNLLFGRRERERERGSSRNGEKIPLVSDCRVRCISAALARKTSRCCLRQTPLKSLYGEGLYVYDICMSSSEFTCLSEALTSIETNVRSWWNVRLWSVNISGY